MVIIWLTRRHPRGTGVWRGFRPAPGIDRPRLSNPCPLQTIPRYDECVTKQPVALMAGRMERPELGRGVVLTSILGFWLFYVVTITLRASVLGLPQQGELAYRRVIVTTLGIVVTILLWQIIRFFDRKPLGVRIAATTFAALPCALAIAAINYYIFNIYDAASLFEEHEMAHVNTRMHMVQELAEFTISRYFFLIAWAALYLALSFANDVRESERRAAVFAQAAQEAELRALRYQVNPHFLFNTLNSLSSLVMSDRKAEAESMIMNLSHFFRSSLTGDPSADVPLSDEVKLQRLYLEIEGARFPKRLTTEFQIPDTLGRAAVPGLILQPLVENAIKHGVSRTTEPVHIVISARADGDRLILTVMDNAAKPTSDPSDGEGIGLSNVRNRLAARFGENAQMEVKRPVAGGFRVILNLPLTQHD
jgi:two-component system, LytTR family, sensor kinase